jgi:hypothetical protein
MNRITTLAAVAASVVLYNRRLYALGSCLSEISGEGAAANAWEFDPVADSWKSRLERNKDQASNSSLP